MKAGEIYVDIGGNLGPLNSAIDTARSTTQSAGITLGEGISASITKTVMAGTAALGAAVVTGLAYGIKSAGEMEAIRTSFDVMLGSAEKGAAMFKDLSEMANRTPFDTEGLAGAAKTLLGFGVAAKDIKPDLGMLGDIAQGNREKFQRLALAFAQVSSAGKLQGQDLLQMIDAGFNPLGVISKQTGKSMGELRQEMEKGSISADMVRDAMVTATSAGGQFFQGMERGSKTWPGIVSTITDNVGKVSRSIVGMDAEGNIKAGSLFNRVKKTAESLGGALTKLSGDIDKVGIGKALDKMIPAKFQYTVVIVAGAITGAMVPSLILLAKAAWAAVPALWAALVPLLPFIAAGAVLAGLALLVYKNWDKISAWFSATWKTVSTEVTGIWNSIKATAISIWKGIADFFTKTIPQTVASVINFFAELPGRIPGLLADLAVKIAYWIGYAAGWLVRKTIEGITGAIEFWVTLPGKVWDCLVKFASYVLEKAGQAKDWLVEKISAGITAAIDWFSKLPGRVWDFISQLPGKIASGATSTASKASELGKGILDNIVDFVKDIPDKVWKFISDIPGRITDAMGSVWEAAKKLAGHIWDGFKEGLGIKSPSYIEKALEKIMGASGATLKALKEDIGQFNALDVPATKLAFIGTGPTVALTGMGGAFQTPQSQQPIAPQMEQETVTNYNFHGPININVPSGKVNDFLSELQRQVTGAGLRRKI
ncbi:MAG: tape measure protein [Actinobacteria bacterium]|nr:tape measure protein [Actinomycetota bacterium]